ncbi:hypothetical protein HQ529_06645 [Candidatus Woesearchaeota archaeon]|nr:hypothetical protein [Candidatus Woesearchaeota archaeon]
MEKQWFQLVYLFLTCQFLLKEILRENIIQKGFLQNVIAIVINISAKILYNICFQKTSETTMEKHRTDEDVEDEWKKFIKLRKKK